MGRIDQVVFVAFDWLMPSNVIDSQVVHTLIALKKRGVSVSLIGAHGVRQETSTKKRLAARERLLKQHAIPYVNLLLPSSTSLLGSLYSIARVQLCLMSKLASSKSCMLLHCRNDIAAFAAIPTKVLFGDKVKLVFHMVGDLISEEVYVKGKPQANLMLRFLLLRRRAVLEKCDAIICVSEAMRATLYQMMGKKKPVYVLPPHADEAIFRFEPQTRQRLRRELGVEGKLVLVYTGSLTPWQCLPSTLCFVRECIALSENVHFLFLSPEIEKARHLVQEGIPADRYTLLHVAYNKVGEVLCASDVGLLFREDNPVNKVASPVKFSEYMVSGLYSAVSAGIGDIDVFLESYPLGLVLPSLRREAMAWGAKKILEQKDLIQNERHRMMRSGIGSERYGFDTYLQKLIEIYGWEVR